MARLQLMRNGMHQVGFAQTDAAIQKQWIERDRATLGHTSGRRICQLVWFAHNKAVKGKSRIQRRTGQVTFNGGARARSTRRRRFARYRLSCVHRSIYNNEFKTFDSSAILDHVGLDMIAVVALDPITKERGWHFELRGSVRKLFQRQRFDPGDKVILSDAFLQLGFHCYPRLMRHAL